MTRSAADAKPSRVARVVVWTLPLFNVAIAIVTQLVVPRMLQLGLSEADYTVYVGLTSVAAYVGLGEGGVLVSLLRELSRLHGAYDLAGFAAEARRSRRLFAVAATIGGVLASVALSSQATLVTGRPTLFLAGALGLVAAAMLELALGSFQAAMLFATGRYLAGQLFGTVSVVAPLGALTAALLLTRSLTAAVWAQALTTMALSLARGVHGAILLRRETRAVESSPKPAPLGTVVGPGALLKLAEVLQSASFPHLLTVLAPWVVPGAIPAGTYANATRLVTQQFVNLLQVHVTRGLAGDDSARAQARENYAVAATFLTSLQLLELAGAAALASTVFAVWLPNQAEHVATLLPFMLAWQALLAACLPADILFVAAGHMRLLGLVRLGSTALGLVAVGLATGPLGRGALGFGLALAALPLAAFGLWGELTLLKSDAPPREVTVRRYGLAFAAALGCVVFRERPMLAVATCALAALPGLPSSIRGVRRLLKR